MLDAWTHHRFGWSETGPLLHYFLAFAWVVYLGETYLDYRQHRLFTETVKPARITYASQEEFEKAQRYGLDKSRLHFISSLWSTIKMMLQFYAGYYPLLWSLAGVLLKQSGFTPEYELTHCLFFYILDAVCETVMSVPLQLVSTFVVEARHGFNKQTPGLFASDLVKGLLLNCLIAPPLIALFIRTIEWGGEQFPLYVAGLFFVVQVLAVPFYSNFVQPCFNKVEPLPEGSLRTSIEQLAARPDVQFPLTGLYVIDGSKRSSHSNAYFYGFWKAKRIVLFDTLISHSSERQVLAVLGHEIGHWALNHTVKGLALSQVQMLALFWCFGQVIHNPSLYNDFGFRSGAQPIYIGLLFFQCLYSPVQHLLTWVMNVVSRRHEFQADAYAAKLGYGRELQEGLITLQKENKSTMIPDPLYSAYHHSHPPLLQRLKAIDESPYMKDSKKES